MVLLQVNLSHIMLNHKMGCSQRMTQVLPYGRFLTKVFKEFGIGLKAKKEIEKSSPFDTYTKSSLGRMKFRKGDDGVWARRVGP